MLEGYAEWFGQKKQQALSELREANPDALQLYGQLLRDNAARSRFARGDPCCGDCARDTR